jgi:hypothetical protein
MPSDGASRDDRAAMTTTHTALSPSSAARWLVCAGSVRANMGDGKSSHYAEEGTAAHALLEMCLRIGCEPEDLRGVNIHEEFHVDDDMIEAVGQAYDYINGWLAHHPRGQVRIERRIHWGAHAALLLDKDVASGTADVTLIDTAPRTRSLVMLDYKHGAGKVVEVEANPQLMLYAVGVLCEYPDFKDIELCVVQPRARHDHGPVRHWTTTRKALDNWVRDVVKPAAKAALKRNAPRVAGDHCRWCAAAPTCRVLVDHVMERAGTEFTTLEPRDPHTMSTEELSRAMGAVQMIEAWCKAVYGRVLESLLAGRTAGLEEWKLVRGRSTRAWDDAGIPKVVAQAASHFKPEQYAPRMLISVAEMEKLFKSQAKGRSKDAQAARAKWLAAFGKLRPFIKQSDPPVHVAPHNDPRDPYVPGSEFGSLVSGDRNDD